MSLKSRTLYRNFLYKHAPLTPEELCELNAKLQLCPVRDLEVLAYVRFGREDITLEQSLNSLLPAITKGVLVYHDPVDELYGVTPKTIAIAEKFCEQNPGFKLIHYPHKVYGAKSSIYRDSTLGIDYQIENRLDTFYNFALDELKKLATSEDPYLLKVDGDHIYDAQAIDHQIYLLNNLPIKIDQLLLPKINMAYLPNLEQVFYCQTIRVEDHFFVRAKAIDFTFFENKKKHSYWEKMHPLFPQTNFYSCLSFSKLALAKQYLDNKPSLLTKLKQLVTFNHYSLAKALKNYFHKLNHNSKLDKKFIILDTCEVSYNSLHFPVQKHWEYEYQYYPNLEEFNKVTWLHQGKPINIRTFSDVSNDTETSLYHTDIVKAADRQQPTYLIQDAQRVLDIAKSFKTKFHKS